MTAPLLELRAVRKEYPVHRGLIVRRQLGAVKAVDGLDLIIRKGETVGLAGESGCGKSTSANLILLLEELTAGEIRFEGKDIAAFSRADLKRYRKSVQAVFQDPLSSLSPRMRVWENIAEPLLVNEQHSRAELRKRVEALLGFVGLNRDAGDQFPHEFSGGQRQRIAIARALALRPALVVLDEPVSALDVSIRAQILNLLSDLQKEFGLAYLLITHDLAVLRHMCDRIGIMYLGKQVETADGEDLYKRPLHPYTQALIASVLPTHPDTDKQIVPLEGEIPSPLHPPSGCRFHTRCPHATPTCFEREPVLKDLGAGHLVACHLY
jgi:oligopeptide transport system ATP-binding protein